MMSELKEKKRNYNEVYKGRFNREIIFFIQSSLLIL